MPHCQNPRLKQQKKRPGLLQPMWLSSNQSKMTERKLSYFDCLSWMRQTHYNKIAIIKHPKPDSIVTTRALKIKAQRQNLIEYNCI